MMKDSWSCYQNLLKGDRKPQLLHFFVQPIREGANSCLVTIKISTKEVSIIFFILFWLLSLIKS